MPRWSVGRRLADTGRLICLGDSDGLAGVCGTLFKLNLPNRSQCIRSSTHFLSEDQTPDMTPKERELLQNFLQQLEQTRVGAKDPDADGMIRDAIVRQPESSYLLVQRAMGLDLALQAAQAQIAKLQADLNAARVPAPAPAATGFLDNVNVWGRQAVPLGQTPQAVRPSPSAVAPQARASAPASAPAPAAPSAWGSGLMGTLATTAAGVVAGSLLYQGIQGLMGHQGSSLAGQSGSGPGGPPAGQSGGVNDLVAQESSPPAGSWSAPDPNDQAVDDRTYLADAADDASYGDDDFA